MPDLIHIHPSDNVAVALHAIQAGTAFLGVTALQDIPQGHKMALRPMAEGEQVVKYGFSIGHATAGVEAGAWVHTHNMKTNLSGEIEYTYHPNITHPALRHARYISPTAGSSINSGTNPKISRGFTFSCEGGKR